MGSLTVAEAPTGGRKIGADDSHTAWTIGPLTMGNRQQAADILTLGHSAVEVASLIDGPSDLVDLFAARVGRH